MVKWAGFYLSEHTDTLQDQKKTESNRPVQKMQMDVDEIGEVLSKAVLKSRKIVIQIEERDSNGYYQYGYCGYDSRFRRIGNLRWWHEGWL